MEPHPAVALAEDEGADALSALERHACDCLPEHRRPDWRAGRLAARRAGAAALGVPRPEHLTVLSARSRLYLCDEEGGTASVTLSLTHRDGRAAAVADAAGRRVGADLERRAAVPEEHERFFLSPRERGAHGFADPTALWALKEAAWKALGCDARTPFCALQLHFDGGGTLAEVSLHGRARPARAELSSPWEGYLLAVLWLPEVPA